jgi:anti-sigma regulatory factor (Ser/Thr protein kinase)
MTPSERTIRLPVELMSVRRARLFARDVVLEWGLEQLVDDVQLAVSELVTNAVRHARSEVELGLCIDGRLIVEVRDTDPELRQPLEDAEADPLATSGRGLQIVAAVSVDWGVRFHRSGKAVWFALDLPDTASPDADVYAMSDRRADETAGEDDERAAESEQMQARAVN